MQTGAEVIGQSSFDAIWWLCLAILIGLFFRGSVVHLLAWKVAG
jgi:hypothetical protein